MKNKEALDFFQKIAETTNSAIDVKLNASNDFTSYDAAFILKHSTPNTSILDLGSGTGLIINKLYKNIGNITAVEPFREFTQHIAIADNITIINSTLLEFTSQPEKYDIISIFGVMHYFNEQEASEIYAKYFPYLKPGGKMIIKNQLGVYDDVTVGGYSEEQKNNYYAQYRHTNKEVEILKRVGFKYVELFDIYPPECNRWDNTHFYAIVAEK